MIAHRGDPQKPKPLGWAASAARTMAAVMFSTDAGAPPRERLDWLAADLSDFFTQAGRGPGRLFGLALFAVLYVAPLLAFRLPLPFTSIPKGVDTLERIERGPLGVALLFIKAILCIVYFEHPDVERTTGYVTPCLAEPEATLDMLKARAS